ncbi:MAG TPA: porin [Burkholderiales bacterium]|nr:porin [Burkholderiales bacterium]
MNKKLMAAAVAGALAVPAVAFAQSSVTLYGTIDTGIRNESKVRTATGDGSLTAITDGLNTTNRWGMKGSEDLGGGLNANFTLEGQYSSDTGVGPASNGLFQRTSKVGLSSSGGGSFDLGRDYTVNFKEFGIYDPMSYNYTGITPNVRFTAGVRSSNMITAAYTANGFNIRGEYALGEVVGSSSDGSRFGLGADYAVGGLKVGGAYSTTNNTQNTGKQKDATLGASYGLNDWTFKLGWSQTQWDSTWATGGGTLNGGGGNGGWYAASATGQLDKARMISLGVGYNFSSRLAGRIGYYDIKSTGFASADDGKLKNTILDLTYSLSKRTSVYAEIDHMGLTASAVGALTPDVNTGGTGGVNDGASGFGVGIAHKF